MARSEESTCKTPAEQVGVSAFAAEWWENAAGRRLPGEEGGYTVFAIEFWDSEDDGVPVTSTSVFERMVVELARGRSMPTAKGVQRRAECTGRLVDTAVVTKGVTGFAWARFELENWSERRESNPPLGDDTRLSHDYFTSFLPRNQTHSIHFSKRAFYGSINKTNARSYTCFTQRWSPKG